MGAWWTNLDIEIVCSHKDELHYIQISSLEDGKNTVECKSCGQKYEVELIISLKKPVNYAAIT